MNTAATVPSPPQAVSQTCSVAIVGTEGTGKTVLITTLAARFGRVSTGGLFLSPSDNHGETYRYVARSWETLSKGRWPPITKRGELFELQWTLKENSTSVAEVRMIDTSGEDLRLLFHDGKIDNPAELPDGLRRVADYLRQAKIVLVLVDLDDIVSNRNGEHVRQTQWVINYALKCAMTTGGRGATALVFTKTDRYEALIQQNGGWRSATGKYLPLVDGNYLANGQLSVLSVAAVADTRVDTSSGTPRPVPAPNFRSLGLDVLMTWIHDRSLKLCELERIRCQEELAHRQAATRQAEQQKRQLIHEHANRLRRNSLAFALVIGLAAQVITLPVMFRLCRSSLSHTVSTPNTVHHSESGHLWWYVPARDETVYDTTTDSVVEPNYLKTIVLDILLTLGLVWITYAVRLNILIAANPPSENIRQ